MIRSSYPKTTKDNALKINMNGTEKSARERRSRTKESRYKEPKSSAVSGRTSANMSNSLFSGILSERDRKPLLSSTVPTMKEINEVKGSNGLRFLSTFTGSGGSELGFLSAGWQNVGCVEFLKSGRDTIMLNDPELFSIEPDLICIHGSRVYEELGGEESLGFKLHKNTARTDKGVKFAPSINWDETHFQITTAKDKEIEKKFSDFRTAVNQHMFSLVPKGRKPLWGDDIRGFDPHVFMDFTGIKPGEIDLVEGSPPCFPAGTQVLTLQGHKSIEDVEVGDVVLTHKGHWRKVTNTMSRISDTVYVDGGRIEATKDHPFYARRVLDGAGKEHDRLGEPEWIDAQDMHGVYHSIPSHAEEFDFVTQSLRHDRDYWEMIGMWIGGNYVEAKIDASGFHAYQDTSGRLPDIMVTYDVDSWSLHRLFGSVGSKRLPGAVLSLEKHLRNDLIRGILSSSSVSKNDDSTLTIKAESRELLLSIKVLIGSVGAETEIIDSNTMIASNFNTSSKIEDEGLTWIKSGAVTEGRKNVTVYDITVEEDHSFVAEGYVVHNCKSFSMSGLRNAAWGKVVKYTDERNERTDSLFFEFYRIIAAFMPRAFVAENVVGIMYGKARDSFLIPLRETFTELGYNVEVRKIKAEEHGVPQSRHRAIFQGIRKDNIDLRNHRSASPEWPETNPYVYNVQDVLEASDELNTPEYIESASVEGREIGKIWDALFPGTSSKSKTFQAQKVDPNFPMPTITAEETRNIGGAGALHPTEKRKFTLPEYKYAFTFPEDYQLSGTVYQQAERVGRSVPPMMMRAIASAVAVVLQNSKVNNNMGFGAHNG